MEGTQSIDMALGGVVTTYERGGQFVTVGKLTSAYEGGQACYQVNGRGSIGLYLGDDSETAEVLRVLEHEDGSWTLWYRPADENFQTYVSELEALGEWR